MVNKALTTADAVTALLGAADPEGLLSCRDSVQMVRSMTNRCELSDGELVELVVLVAMKRHARAISFDLHSRAPALQPIA